MYTDIFLKCKYSLKHMKYQKKKKNHNQKHEITFWSSYLEVATETKFFIVNDGFKFQNKSVPHLANELAETKSVDPLKSI